ncbi:MAG: right-handed parallel beta-helix repeat-containing protein [Planctomycetota bacterium]
MRRLLLTLLLAGTTSAQTTWYVDCANPSCPGKGIPSDPFCSIQDAIRSASDGDTISVASCTYLENIDFLGKKITVSSQSGPQSTTIDGNAAGPVVSFQMGETSASILDGFTLTNGSACNGGGVFCFNTSPMIVNTTIVGNQAQGLPPCGTGGGIAFGGFASASLIDSRVQGNTASYGGGVHAYGSPSIVSSTITGNNATIGAGVYFVVGLGATIEDSTISGNTALYYGGGLEMNQSTITIRSSTISGNTAGAGGGGIDQFLVSDLTLENSVVAGNTTAAPGGAGIHTYSPIPGQKLTITNSNFSGNTSATSGAALYSRPAGSGGTSFTIRNTIFWGDSPSELAIGIGGDQVSLEHSNIQGGYPGTGNIASDPLFVDAAQDDFRLQCASPCIAAGTPTPPGSLPAFDHSGLDDRVLGTIDIGADECGLDWSLVGTPIAGGPPVHFQATAPLDLGRASAEVLISRGDGGLSLPAAGGRLLGLDHDGALSFWCSLPAATRSVVLANCTGAATAPVSVPAGVAVGTQIHYAGMAWDPATGRVRSLSETRSFQVQ